MKMGKLIQDVIPPDQQEYDTKPTGMAAYTEVELITELFNRGISIEYIFSGYYALEEQAGARDDEIFGNDEEGQHGAPRLTVGDALLVAPPLPPKRPLGEVPF